MDVQKQTNLFEELWSKGKAAVKSIEKPFTAGDMKRALKSAASDTIKKQFEAQRKLHDEYAKFADFDINKCIEHKETIRKAKATLVHIKSIWTEIFNTEMPDVMDE